MAGVEDIENDDKDRLLPDLSAIDKKQGNQESKLMTYIQCCKYIKAIWSYHHQWQSKMPYVCTCIIFEK